MKYSHGEDHYIKGQVKFHTNPELIPLYFKVWETEPDYTETDYPHEIIYMQ